MEGKLQNHMISTVILYKNERKSLERCLKSLEWCSDVVIVQDAQNAQSDLPELRPGISVVRRLLQDNFSAQRMFGMQQAKNDWVLFIDADEELSPELCKVLDALVPDIKLAGYAIPRIDIFWGQKLLCGEVESAAKQGIVRLVHKQKGVWEGVVHERFKPNGAIGRLHQVIFHYPHQNISEFMKDVNYYSSLRAKEVANRPVWQLFAELLLYPPSKFFYTYFVRLGFLDGAAGFVYSFMMSFHSFLVRAKALTKTW